MPKSSSIIPITGIQLDRPMKYGLVFQGHDGSIGPIDNNKGKQIWSYSLPNHSFSDSSMGFSMSVAWRFQCSK